MIKVIPIWFIFFVCLTTITAVDLPPLPNIASPNTGQSTSVPQLNPASQPSPLQQNSSQNTPPANNNAALELKLPNILDDKETLKLPELPSDNHDKSVKLPEQQRSSTPQTIPVEPKTPTQSQKQQPEIQKLLPPQSQHIVPPITAPVTPPALQQPLPPQNLLPVSPHPSVPTNPNENLEAKKEQISPPSVPVSNTPSPTPESINSPKPVILTPIKPQEEKPKSSEEHKASPTLPAKNLLPVNPQHKEEAPTSSEHNVAPTIQTPKPENQGSHTEEESDKEIQEIENQKTTEDLFVTRELKVFEGLNDDVVLGQVTEEAEIENMDFPQYSKLYEKSIQKNLGLKAKDKTNKFIRNTKTKLHRKLDPESLKMMMDSNPDFFLSFSPEEVNYLTILATRNGDVELLRLMIDNYYSLHILDHENNSLLMLAVMSNQDKVVSYLLHKGIDPNIANIRNETPLIIASKNHNHTIIKLLKEAGAFGDIDPNDLEIPEDFDVKF